MYNVVYFMTGCMSTFTRDGKEIEFWSCNFVFFQTALHNAAWMGVGDVVEILLRNGANVNEKKCKKAQKWEVIELLILLKTSISFFKFTSDCTLDHLIIGICMSLICCNPSLPFQWHSMWFGSHNLSLLRTFSFSLSLYSVSHFPNLFAHCG